MSDTPARFTLRQLPLPAKLVVTAFLFAVGLGYVSAMVQLHINHSDRDGNPLPTPANVIERFSGLKEFDPDAPIPCSRMDTLLTGNPKAAEVTKDNMAPAFFAASKDWAKESAPPRRAPGGRTPAVAVEELREGERLALLAWVRNEDRTAKQAAYEGDRFPLPEPVKALKITEDFLTPTKELKVRSLIEARCQYCHKEQEPKLATYAALEKWVNPPSQELIADKWVRSPKQMSVEKLTQSTHAHLLSFAVLFGVTGLVFAFTSYPTILRATLGPVVLLAQVADISCWWLARMPPPYGPTFALTIMGTGAVVGLGLILQIVLSLLNLYGPRGKLLIVLLMAVVGGGLGYVGLKVIQPALDEEKAAATKLVEQGRKPDGKVDPPAVPLSPLEKLIMGPREGAAWNGKGSMAPAFFEKESEFKKLKRTNSPELPKREAERQSERLAIQAWIQTEPAARKKAYDEDKLPLPATLVGKPLTGDFADGSTFVKVKSILESRCVNCHAAGAEQDKFPLDTYEQIMKYVEAKPAAVGNVIPPAKGD